MGKLCGCLTVAEELADHEERITDLEDTVVAVVANPGTTGTVDLTKLLVGTTTYSIPAQTTVVANPSGTGTQSLGKLQVGSTVYSIPTGEGSNYYQSRITLNFSNGDSAYLSFLGINLFEEDTTDVTEIWDALNDSYTTNPLPITGVLIHNSAFYHIYAFKVAASTTSNQFAFDSIGSDGIAYSSNSMTASTGSCKAGIPLQLEV